MTEEESFNVILDDDPTNYIARLVYADWLQDRNDPRAEGYRALAKGGHRPFRADGRLPNGIIVRFEDGVSWEWWHPNDNDEIVEDTLPRQWFDLIECLNPYYMKNSENPLSKDFFTRQEAEDAAALAYPQYALTLKEKIDVEV